MIGSPSKVIKQLARTSGKIGQSVMSGGSSITSSISSSISASRKDLTRGMSNLSLTSNSSHSKKKEERDPYLLERLGGMVALKSIIHEFSRRVTTDPALQIFFQGVDPKLLTAHQERFFAMAFTKVNMASATVVIHTVHRPLYARGLCEDHFDIFCKHLAQVLTDRGFGAAIVDESMAILKPLRDIFQEAAEEYRRTKNQLKKARSCPSNTNNNTSTTTTTAGHPVRT